MTEVQYRLSTATIPIIVAQGVTYRQRWNFMYQDPARPFPFFADDGSPLWKGRCMFRVDYSDDSPALSLTTEDGGVTMDYIDNADNMRSAFYGLFVTAIQAATLPPGKLVYDIEFERLSDGWVIRPQKGKATVDPEVTK